MAERQFTGATFVKLVKVRRTFREKKKLVGIVRKATRGARRHKLSCDTYELEIELGLFGWRFEETANNPFSR